MKVKSESEIAQSCPTLSNPMDCSPPGSSAYGIFQARALEWVPLTSLTVYYSEKEKTLMLGKIEGRRRRDNRG